MRKLFILFALIMVFFINGSKGAVITSTTTGGHWDQTDTWAGGISPGDSDTVVIEGPVILKYDIPVIERLEINNSGSLEDGTGSKITVIGDALIYGPVNTNQDIEFNLGGDLYLYDDWIGSLNFTGTEDHNVTMSDTVNFNPNGSILALESKIIANSDIYLTSTNYSDFVAKEIELSGNFSMHLNNIRLGSNSTTYGITTKITGNGNTIYFNDNQPNYQCFYQACDLYDLNFAGNTYFNVNVDLYGEAVNQDSLFTAVGIGEYTVDVIDNFTNNGVVDSDLKFNFFGDFTNNGPFQANEINFKGENDHILKTLNNNWIVPNYKFNCIEGTLTAGSDLYIKGNGYVNFIVTDLILDGEYDLYSESLRIGSSNSVTDYGFRCKITGNGNTIYFNDNQPNYQCFYQACDLYDVNFAGNTYFNADVDLYGEAINLDSLFTAVGIGEYTVDVMGNFTNNGLVDSDLNFNFTHNFTNNGAFQANQIIFKDPNDHIFTTLDTNWVSTYSKFACIEGTLTAGSDLYIASNGGLNLIATNLILPYNYNLHTKNLKIGDNYSTTEYGFRTMITGNENTIYFNDNIPNYQHYYQGCDLHDITLAGNTYLGSGVAFYGETVNQDSLFTGVGTGAYSIDIVGNFTNKGYVNNDLKFHFFKDFRNSGYFQSGEANFVGTEDQYILAEESFSAHIDFRALMGSSSFQWQLDGEDITGETNPSLIFTTITQSEFGTYQCITDAGNSRLIKVQLQEDPPFIIKGVQAKIQDSSSAYIIWNTSVPTQGLLFYAENDTTYGYPMEAMETGFKTKHEILLTDLNYGSTYYFFLDQYDEEWNNVYSEPYSFVAGDMTLGANKILAIQDVPEDQGGWVYVDFSADMLDATGKIEMYGIWEYIEEKWVSLGSVPATQDTAYRFLAHTYSDSSQNGIFWSKFYVTAHTTDPLVYYTSAIDSGYSVDNLAPEAPAGFAGTLSESSIALSWKRNDEDDLQYYNVYKNDLKIASITDTAFIDNELEDNNYNYYVTAVDAHGNESEQSDIVSITVQTETERLLPDQYSLLQNYPNPFNPSTTIKYTLPKTSHVNLTIYNSAGQIVDILVDKNQEAGIYHLNWNALNMPSGIYFYKLIAGKYTNMKKCLLVK